MNKNIHKVYMYIMLYIASL